MKDFIGGHVAVSDADLVELSMGAGTPLELWLGEENETEEERAARLDAARDILADDPELIDRVTRTAVRALEAGAPELLNVIPLTRRGPADSRTAGRRAVA
ncbi:hypothetical protein [Streptomyces sp. JJ36]|uniref:hypothetical protein n=1 Tax=Streptomyces sp. JJ36 TaxID=2736645 RepID=UPI001F1ACC55|nr:hypothetical protein [Streptomyces sp. JJ36]MCF6525674.1 hypothetical protein [Streptomyces sp. JJ36]